MEFLYIYHRHPHLHMDAEARLCHMTGTFGGNKNVPEGPRPSPKEPDGLLRSLSLKLPFLSSCILNHDKELDAIKLTHLTDDSKWIQAFRSAPEVLTKTNIPVTLVKSHPHIAEFLQSIPNLEDRQKIYLEYIDYLIPEEQQIKLNISKLSLSPAQRTANVLAQLPKTNAIFGAMFGVEGWRDDVFGADETEAELIAKESLTNHYKNPNLNYPDTKNNNLDLDVKAAVSYGSVTSNFRPAAINPDLLMNQVDDSLLKGALQLGVINRTDLDVLQKDSEQEQHEFNLAVDRASTKLERLTQATKLKQQIEAHGLREMWDDMPGAAKLAIFVLGGLALARKGWTRVVVGTPLAVLTGLYFIQKSPILKQDDPIKHWDAVLAGIGNKIKGVNKELPGNNNNKLDVNDTITKASFMMSYLSKFDREHMETQSVGLALLAPVPMETLARNFIRNKDGSRWGLDFASPTLKKAAKKGLKDMGWKESAYDEFFANEEHVLQVNEVIGNLFYTMAAKNPKYHDEARLVEDVHGQVERGGGLSTLGGKDRFSFVRSAPVFDDLQRDANEAYIRMVGGGKAMADFDSRSLEQYISDSMGFTALIAAIDDDKGSLPSKTTVYPGSQPSHVTDDPGSKPSNIPTDPGSLPSKTRTYPGSTPSKTTSDPGSYPSSTTEDPGSKPSTTQTEAGSEPSKNTPDPGSEHRSPPSQTGNRPSSDRPLESGSNPFAPEEDKGSLPTNKEKNKGETSK